MDSVVSFLVTSPSAAGGGRSRGRQAKAAGGAERYEPGLLRERGPQTKFGRGGQRFTLGPGIWECVFR